MSRLIRLFSRPRAFMFLLALTIPALAQETPDSEKISVLAEPVEGFTPEEGTFALGHKFERPALTATPIPYLPSDFINIVREPLKPTYMLGEPIELSMRLINHTHQPSTLQTNFNPRSLQKIQIRMIEPEPGKIVDHPGPYRSGEYTPVDYSLYPFEELPVDSLIWGDWDTHNGLAFTKPGKYAVQVIQTLGAALSQIKGPVQTEPFVVEILPPSPELAPLIQIIADDRGFQDLHLRKVPGGKIEKYEKLLVDYPKTFLAPYIHYALGLHYYGELIADTENVELFNKANNHLQIASSMPSYMETDILQDLINLYDRMQQANLAKETAQRLIDISRKELAMRRGSLSMMQKYLIDSQEMDPVMYWNLFE